LLEIPLPKNSELKELEFKDCKLVNPENTDSDPEDSDPEDSDPEEDLPQDYVLESYETVDSYFDLLIFWGKCFPIVFSKNTYHGEIEKIKFSPKLIKDESGKKVCIAEVSIKQSQEDKFQMVGKYTINEEFRLFSLDAKRLLGLQWKISEYQAGGNWIAQPNTNRRTRKLRHR